MSSEIPRFGAGRSLHGLLVASIIVPVAVFVAAAWESRRELYQEAERSVRRQTAILYEHAAKVLQAQQLVIEQVQERVRGRSWAEIRASDTVWNDLHRLAGNVQHVDAIFLIDPQGRTALTTRVRPSPETDFLDRDYFKAHQKLAEPPLFLSARYTGRISGRPIFNLSMRRGVGDAFDGVVGVSAFIEYFERVYATVAEAREGAFVSLERDDGQVLASYPPAGASSRAILSRAQIENRAEGLVYVADQETEESALTGYRKLPHLPAFVAYGLKESVLLATWYRRLVPWALLTLAAAGVLTLASWLALRTARREAVAVENLLRSQADLVLETDRRQQAEVALLQSQKLEALGQLTAGVAHDFGNLLQILKGYLAVAKARATDDRVRAPLVTCEGAVQRSEKLMQHLLAFARRQPLSHELFDLNQRLPTMLPALQQLGSNINVKLELPPDLWPVDADPTQLELALINLVANARDAMPHGGTVRVSAANQTLVPSAAEAVGDFVAVIVEDDGEGIAPEKLTRVWEPFFTTKAAGKGTGLGLAMVYGFAKQSGGFASIESHPGNGTTVTMFFPKGPGMRVSEGPPPASAESSSVVRLRPD